MHPKLKLWFLGILILPTLACASINRLAEGGSVLATATPEVAADPSLPSDGENLVLPSGLTIGSPRETRVAFSEANPEALGSRANETYTDEEYNTVGNTLTFTLSARESDRLFWVYGWCATTPELLEDNLGKMQIEFVVEDTVLPQSQFDAFDDVQVASDGTELPCRTYMAVVYNWPGGLNTLETRITFLEKINDGMGDFDAGKIVFKYEVLGQ